MDVHEFRFAFFAKDFEKSVAFYERTLGMPRVGGWDRTDGKGALLAANATAVVEIYGAASGKTYEGPSPVGLNLALRLADADTVNKLYSQLKAAGEDVTEPPEDRIWGHRSFTISDPDGIPVHIYCELN